MEPGNIRYEQSSSSGNSIAKFTGYTGQELDEETGLMYYRARFYDPSLGRFLTPDTVIPAGGRVSAAFNRYLYARANPIRYTDPSGHSWADALDSWDDWMKMHFSNGANLLGLQALAKQLKSPVQKFKDSLPRGWTQGSQLLGGFSNLNVYSVFGGQDMFLGVGSKGARPNLLWSFDLKGKYKRWAESATDYYHKHKYSIWLVVAITILVVCTVCWSATKFLYTVWLKYAGIIAAYDSALNYHQGGGRIVGGYLIAGLLGWLVPGFGLYWGQTDRRQDTMVDIINDDYIRRFYETRSDKER